MAKERRYGKKLAMTLVCGLLCGGVAAGGLAGYSYYKQKQEEKSELQNETDALTDTKPVVGEVIPVASEEGTEGRVSSVYDVSVIWDNVIPAMVEIDTRIVTSYEFFGRIYEEESEGSGTGIIVAQGEELFLVTNHHVVDGARAIQVTFFDGSTAKAEVKGSNAGDDIAVLSVQFSDIAEETAKKIKVATVGSSDNLQSGEMVIAIGNAAGTGQSLTVGYVSAVDREIELDGGTMRLIQTDAAINPGNSGGALLNAKGELIGINNAKLVASHVEGVGYAIPISNVISLIQHIMNREEISLKMSAVLGIEGRDVIENVSGLLEIPKGVYVVDFTEGSAAEAAGIPLYSIITKVNGMEVTSMEQLKEVLRYTRGNTEGTVTVQERVEGIYTPKEYKITFGLYGK